MFVEYTYTIFEYYFPYILEDRQVSSYYSENQGNCYSIRLDFDFEVYKH